MVRRIVCTVPEGRLSDGVRRELEAVVRRRSREFFGADGWTAVLWRTVPSGQMFADGRPAAGSVVVVEADDGFDQARREEALRAISGDWAAVTGTGERHLLLAIVDSSALARQQARERGRFRGPWGAWFFARIAASLAASALRRLPLAIPANY
ncbi:MAG: hypothetical protein ACRC20_13730 [Segniliparus sp.]